jgi:hypothetical protein
MEEKAEVPLSRRLAWLAAIWTSSVLGLAMFAGLLRLLMSAAGLRTP